MIGTRLLDLEKFLQWMKKYFVITCKDQLYWMKFQWRQYRLCLLFTFEHFLRIAINYHDRSNPGKICFFFFLLPLDSNYHLCLEISGFQEEWSQVTISDPSNILHCCLLVQYYLLPMRQRAAHIHFNTPWINFNPCHF